MAKTFLKAASIRFHVFPGLAVQAVSWRDARVMTRRAAFLLVSLSPLPSLAASRVLPVLNHPVADVVTTPGAAAMTVPIAANFGTEPVDDQAVRFSSNFTSGGSPVVMEMALFSTRTPIARTNFLNYVSSGRYVDSLIHRSVPGFVIQGGGYYFDASDNVAAVTTDAPIQNEFGVSNTYATVSMAKLGGNPNSATSQWFVSLGDNSANLDTQNSGFTVFGRVTQSTMANAAIFGNPNYFIPSALTHTSETWLPQEFESAFMQTPCFYSSGALIYFPAVSLVALTDADAGTSTALTYASTTVSNSATSTVSFQNNTVTVTPPASQLGTTVVKVTATDSVGNKVDDSFTVTVRSDYAYWRKTAFTTGQTDDAVSGPNADPDGDGVDNLELYLHSLPTGATSKPPVTAADFLDGTNHRPRFTFALRNDVAGATYTLEKTVTPGEAASWVSVPVTVVSKTAVSATLDTLVIQPVDAVSGTPVFYRVKFTAQ